MKDKKDILFLFSFNLFEAAAKFGKF